MELMEQRVLSGLGKSIAEFTLQVSTPAQALVQCSSQVHSGLLSHDVLCLNTDMPFFFFFSVEDIFLIASTGMCKRTRN